MMNMGGRGTASRTRKQSQRIPEGHSRKNNTAGKLSSKNALERNYGKH
jgi:hypothetical protein